VAEAVVDDLEAVEVDEHHRDVAAGALEAAERALQAAHQEEAAGQSRERVAQEVLLVGAPRRHVRWRPSSRCAGSRRPWGSIERTRAKRRERATLDVGTPASGTAADAGAEGGTRPESAAT